MKLFTQIRLALKIYSYSDLEKVFEYGKEIGRTEANKAYDEFLEANATEEMRRLFDNTKK